MANVNVHELAATEEEVKPKRTRKVTPKVEKTGEQIIAEINELEEDVKELEIAVSEVDPNSVLYPTVSGILLDKKDELEKALNFKYTL